MDFNKLKEMGLEYAEKGRTAALDLAQKSKTQAKIVSEQGKLLKAQRQLGALVYSLAKGNEENQPLVDKYIDMIDSIEQEIARLEEIVAALEKGDAPLADSLALFEEGTKLIAACSQELDAAEQKVVKLMKGPDGTPVELPFGEEEQG